MRELDKDEDLLLHHWYITCDKDNNTCQALITVMGYEIYGNHNHSIEFKTYSKIGMLESKANFSQQEFGNYTYYDITEGVESFTEEDIFLIKLKYKCNEEAVGAMERFVRNDG